MPKLSNGVEYANELVKIELPEYLLANGFDSRPAPFDKNILAFKKKSCTVVFQPRNKVQRLLILLDKTSANLVDMPLSSDFELFDFMLLLHGTGVVKLQDFIKAAKTQNVQAYVEARMTVRNLIHVIGKDAAPGLLAEEPVCEVDTAYDWVYRVLLSCVTPLQSEMAAKLIDLFKLKFPDEVKAGERLETVFGAVASKIGPDTSTNVLTCAVCEKKEFIRIPGEDEILECENCGHPVNF